MKAMVPRVALVVLAIAFQQACARTGNTLAQDLAWDRWQKCSSVGGVRLTRIDPDGQVWVEYSNGGAQVTAWKECMQKAAAEQAARRVVAAPPPAPGAPAPREAAKQQAAVQASSLASPGWNVGDEWAYRYESPTGTGTYVWSVDREEAIDGVRHYVIKTGTREIFYRKSDLATTKETVDGSVVLLVTPSRLQYVWRLEVGKTWEQAFREERPVARQTTERVDVVTVEAEETVTVPAGTFKTLKIVYRVKGTGAMRYEAWYAPELRQLVQLRERLESGLRTRELIAYKLR